MNRWLIERGKTGPLLAVRFRYFRPGIAYMGWDLHWSVGVSFGGRFVEVFRYRRAK